jgi:hypothetical protein
MRSFWIAGILLAAAVTGCASPGIDEVRLKQFEMDLKAEFRTQIEAARKEMQAEISKDKLELQSDINDVREGARSEVSALKTLHDSDNVERQKQFFSNKRLIEDQAKRVYLIESIVTTKAASTEYKKEDGFVTSIEGENIAISIGGERDIKSGDEIGIYKGDERVASGKITKVGTSSSEGVLVTEEEEVSVGDTVKPVE